MKVIDFIKAIFLPRHMRKFRYMSVLFSICIFVLSMYAIVFPAQVFYNNNTDDLIKDNDLYYLQSIINMPSKGEDVLKFVSQINEKKFSSVDGKGSCANLGLKDITVDNSITGIFERVDTFWYFNGKSTGVVFTDDGLTLSLGNNKVVVCNIDVPFEGVTETDTFEKLSLSVDNRSLLLINGEIAKTMENGLEKTILINKNNPTVKVVDNYLYVDEIKTNFFVGDGKKVFIEFIPNLNVTYYEDTFTYTDDKGINNYIKFIIDLEITDYNGIRFIYKDNETLYPDIQNGSYFFIALTKNFLYYQAHPVGIEELKINRTDIENNYLKHGALATYYANSPVNTDDFNYETFNSYITSKIGEGYKVLAVQSFNITAFIYVIVYTAIITLLFFLLFKKTGRLKTLKEYYNIAAISSITPSLICFILVFFDPIIFGSVYLFVFAIYYLFVLYRINSSPETMI